MTQQNYKSFTTFKKIILLSILFIFWWNVYVRYGNGSGNGTFQSNRYFKVWFQLITFAIKFSITAWDKCALFSTAKWYAVFPSSFSSMTSLQLCRSSFVQCGKLLAAAKWRGVFPQMSICEILAPNFSKSRTISWWPLAAKCKGEMKFSASLFGFALSSSNVATVFSWPVQNSISSSGFSSIEPLKRYRKSKPNEGMWIRRCLIGLCYLDVWCHLRLLLLLNN